MCRLDIICIGDCLYICRIVEAILQNLLVRFYQFRLLLSELLLKILEDILHRTIVYVASHTECEHILTLVHCLVVKSAVLETFMSKSGYRSDYYSSVFNMELGYRVIIVQSGPFQTILIECVRVYKDHGRPLEPLCVSLESCRIHCHKEVTVIARSSDVLAADVYLKTGNSGNRSVRSPDFCRIIRKCGKLITKDC